MKTLVLILACLIVAIPCSADVITVDPNGTGDYPTIQAAIDAASVGDTVIVVEGIYTEDVSCVSEITIHFTGTTTINGQVTTGSETSIIADADLTINSDSDITLGGPVTVGGMLGLYADGDIVINNTVQALEIEMISNGSVNINAAVIAMVSVDISAGLDVTVYDIVAASIVNISAAGTIIIDVSTGDIIINSSASVDAGADITVYAGVEGAEVQLDASGSYDVDGDELEYYWSWEIAGEIYEANGVNPIIELPVGVHTIELIVNDGIIDSLPGEVIVVIASSIPVLVDATIYVDKDATGSGDGSSWSDAFTGLQSALDAAMPGNEIRVAEGTYLPDTSGLADPREASFALKNWVTVKGGFAGYGTADPNDRDVELYKTVLSGDLNDDDVEIEDPAELQDEPSRDENSYHVVTGSGNGPNTILDGFTITAGNANGSDPYNKGGGMYNRSFPTPPPGPPGPPGGPGGPGDIPDDGDEDPNDQIGTPDPPGGPGDLVMGVYNAGSSGPTISNCIFSSNSATYGGGMFNDDNSSPTVTNCTFTGNSTDWGGGGMHNYDHSSPTVTGCVFTGNLAYDFGGGMANGWNTSPTVTNCTFTGNSSTYTNGGGMANSFSSPTVTNCAFTGNSADNWGGGMSNYDSNPTVTGCTFTGNSADWGGGMYNEYDSSPTITNCILWGNTATNGNEIYNYADIKHPSTPIINYCDIAGSGGSGAGWDTNLGTDGGGNIEAEPAFVDHNGPDGIIGTEDDNLQLLPWSPCIDVGDNSVVDANSTDLDGNERIINGIVDMGAYEALLPVEADVHIVPRVINRRSRMKSVIAIVRLPEGIGRQDVADEPFELYAADLDGEPIEAIWQRVIGWGRRARVFAMFDKAELMDAAASNGRVELTVVGKLESGQYIQGSDTIRIIQPRRRSWRRRRW